MKPHAILILSIALLLAGYAHSQEKVLSASSCISELDRISSDVENNNTDISFLAELEKKMPESWTVQFEGNRFRISSEQIKFGLRELQSKNSDDARRALLSRIASLKKDIQEFQHERQDNGLEKKAISKILARREFRNAHGPTWWEKFQNRIRLFILELLSGIIGRSSIADISKIAIYVLVAAAILILSVWIIRSIRYAAGIETIKMQAAVPVSARHWNDWMAEAQQAAAKGLWREAIHLSYWAGISHLESKGLWRPDAARTPREYLRLIQPSSEYRDPLFALTRQFEKIWYGRAAAGPDSFAEALNRLECMGCRSN
jgi:hypothetical protein